MALEAGHWVQGGTSPIVGTTSDTRESLAELGWLLLLPPKQGKVSLLGTDLSWRGWPKWEVELGSRKRLPP